MNPNIKTEPLDLEDGNSFSVPVPECFTIVKIETADTSYDKSPVIPQEGFIEDDSTKQPLLYNRTIVKEDPEGNLHKIKKKSELLMPETLKYFAHLIF